MENALDCVREVVEDTLSYMRQMESAPPLLADGLSGDYRVLAPNFAPRGYGGQIHRRCLTAMDADCRYCLQ